MSYTLIERKELTGSASSISFDNIPQFYTDLVVLLSLRSSDTGDAKGSYYTIAINGGGSSTTTRYLQGNGSSVSSGPLNGLAGVASTTGGTSNTFANDILYITNYASSIAKSYLVDSVSENNATGAYQTTVGGFWNNTNIINALTFTPSVGNLIAGSSISLYGINRQQAIGAPKAIGGQISLANGYWTHTFTGSGTFFAQEDLTIDALVIGGGGGGGRQAGGGGGAGGFLTITGAKLNAKSSTPVTVGAGGLGMTSTQTSASPSNGFSSSFLTATAIGGGGGGGYNNGINGNTWNGATGGSGGGAWANLTAGSGTAGQGNNGANGTTNGSFYSETAGGGGGAGGVGIAGNSSSAGAGGIGLPWMGGTYYAGGGGAGGPSSGTAANSFGAGGLGGGGRGGQRDSVNGFDGTANTGGGGGGSSYSGQPGTIGVAGNGGSGVVIVRYKA